MALDQDVFDGQHAVLPRGYGFEHDLGRREKTHTAGNKENMSPAECLGEGIIFVICPR